LAGNGSFSYNGTVLGRADGCVAPELLGLGHGTHDEGGQTEATTVIIYSRVLSNSECSKIVDTLSEKYGIQLS